MSTSTSTTTTFTRLPPYPSPQHYNLSYGWVDLEKCTFDNAKVSIDMINKSEQPITTITLHAVNLWIKSAMITSSTTTTTSSSSLKATTISTNIPSQTITMEFPSPIPTQPFILTIDFAGELNEQLAGFYKSIVKPGQAMGITQFEATDARRAFPVADEPARKATFQLTLTTSPQYLVLSNTRPVTITQHTGSCRNGTLREEKTWVFAPTPKMSSYLLAWFVTDHVVDCLSQTSSKSGVETIVYVPKGKASEGQYALDIGVKVLDLFAELFDIPFPMKCMQHVACPDFSAGAMENWGLITYREVRLMVNAKTSNSAKRDVARVVSHEISHQHFGNLVTMEWWTDLWLNEGFARFCEFVALHAVAPELNPEIMFVLDVLGAALKLDALKSSHPIRVEVNHPDEINEIFDAVSYAKGACVLRMLTHYMTQDAFFKGVSAYLKKFSYSNAISDDLWDSLELAVPDGVKSGTTPTVKELAGSWTTLTGFPLLQIHEGGKLTQRRYLSLGETALTEEDKLKRWMIPVCVIPLKSSHQPRRFIIYPPSSYSKEQDNDSDTTTTATTKELETYLKQLDTQQIPYLLNGDLDLFRVAYLDSQWRTIARACSLLSATARLGFVRDAFDLAESGEIAVTTPLEICLSIFPSERQVAVLVVALRALAVLCDLYDGNESFIQLFVKQVISPLVEPWCKVLGPFQSGSPTEQMMFEGQDKGLIDELRVLVIKLSVFIENKMGGGVVGVGQEAFQRLLAHCDGSSFLSPDIRAIVFKMGATTGGERALQALCTRYGSAEIMERREILNALGGFKTRELLNKALDFVCSPQVRSQDVPLCVSSICSSSKLGSRLVWERFQADFNWWFSRFSDGNFLWSGIIGAIAVLPTLDEAQGVAEFFNKVKPGTIGSAKRALDQALEKVSSKEKQLGRDLLELGKWLKV
jgi:aminopeptidase N